MKNKKEIFGWAMFDFANSAYTTNVVTVIFANYFVQAVVPPGENGKTLWGVAITISNLLIVFSAPVIGAIGDYSSSRKKFLVVTCLLCVVGTAGLYYATPGAVVLGMFLFVISNYFFQISESICSSFLPDLAEPHELGKISGLGWGLGYIGGLVALVACLPFIGEDFGPRYATSLRLTNLVTAALFLLAAIPTFILLKEHGAPRVLPEGATYLGMGFLRVRQTLTHLRELKDLSLFLGVFLLMAVALTTVFSFSTIYSSEEMGFKTGELMILFIVVQISAASGAVVFGYVQDTIGLKLSIQILLIVWFLTLFGVFLTTSVTVYWGLVLLLGAGLGSIQSAARAMVGYLAPRSKKAEIFGFWSLTYKVGGLFGPLLYGAVSDQFSHRKAMLTIAVFFLLAFLLDFLVDQERGRRDGLDFEAKIAKASPS